MAEQNEILKEIATQPTNQDFMKERREIEDHILKCEKNFNNEVEMKITDNKKMAHRMHGTAIVRLLRILRRAEGKCTHCCLVNALKYW
jgi:hypothetical protein